MLPLMAGSVGGKMTLCLLSVQAESSLEQKGLQVIVHKHNYFLGFIIIFGIVEGTDGKWSLP